MLTGLKTNFSKFEHSTTLSSKDMTIDLDFPFKKGFFLKEFCQGCQQQKNFKKLLHVCNSQEVLLAELLPKQSKG